MYDAEMIMCLINFDDDDDDNYYEGVMYGVQCVAQGMQSYFSEGITCCHCDPIKFNFNVMCKFVSYLSLNNV